MSLGRQWFWPCSRKSISASFLSLLISTQFVYAQNQTQSDVNHDIAVHLFQRIAGVPLTPKDPRLQQMVDMVSKGDYSGAAAIATEDKNFYNVTLKNWAATYSNKDESPYVPLDDLQALLIGATRDGLDARQLLSGNVAYTGGTTYGEVSLTNNSHYLLMDQKRADLKSVLKLSTQTSVPTDVAAGVLTTRAWAQAHYIAGTNRRALEYTFKEFLCTPIAVWKDSGLPDKRVRQDVDRVPGLEPKTYQTQCRTCHAGMDGMAGAFSRFDFSQDTFTILPSGFVAPKYRQNANVYPEGYKTGDDSWINFSTRNHNQAFGWKNVLPDQTIVGKGVQQFGAMIAATEGFKTCLAKKVFKTICGRQDGADDAGNIMSVSQKFGNNNYNLKKLFQDVSVLPGCAGVP